MKTPLFAALAVLLAVSAQAQVQAVRPQPWLEGQHSGVKQTEAFAVQDSAKWTEVWHQHDASAPAPRVDFSNESIVVVFLGQTETAGVKVSFVVQQDPLDSDRLNVFYRAVASKKAFAAQVECEPYAMVKVRRVAVIDVERDGVVSTPEREAPASAKYDGTKVKALIQAPAFDGN